MTDINSLDKNELPFAESTASSQSRSRSQAHEHVTGFSGNEIYCLDKAGYSAGRICFGNSVMSLGVAKGLGATLSNLAGGEVGEITSLIHEARQRAYHRMIEEAKSYGGQGVAGVAFEIINHGAQIEFIAVGSTVHTDKAEPFFSTSSTGQALLCQMDAGFKPRGFVFGNIAYSIGVGGSLKAMVTRLKRGEVAEYTEIFDHTRHAALDRLKQEAKAKKANAVVGITTSIAPFLGAQEMMMLGTASEHPALAEHYGDPITCNLTNQELWNMVNMGYMPVQLVMGVSVYSLGLAGGMRSSLKSLSRGEISTTTKLLYEARDKALERVHRDAKACQADEVVGVKTRIYDLGNGLIECMVIGTAMKKIPTAKTKSETMIPQAFTIEQDTFFDSEGNAIGLNQSQSASARKTQAGPMSIIATVFFVVVYTFIFMSGK